MIVVHQWIEAKGRMSMISIRPRHPTLHMSAFRIFKTKQVSLVKDWREIVKERREVLGSKQRRYPRLGDRFICMLQYDESGALRMFYAILPEREQ